MTQHYRLASMAAWLSSTGISHHNLLPHIPLIRLSAVNNNSRPGIAPQSLNSSSQPLHCLGVIWLQQDSLILIPFRLPQISCFTLSLKCFSSDSDNCPNVGIESLPQFPYLTSRSSPTKTPAFPPSSFLLPSFVWFYIFFSAGQVLLSTLSWCSTVMPKSQNLPMTTREPISDAKAREFLLPSSSWGSH